MAVRKRAKHVHKKRLASYTFKPKAGTEKYRYRCPFCGLMTHSERFSTLNIPVLDADVMLYGGYRGLQVRKTVMSTEMRLRVLTAMKEKIDWLYEKIGSENLWLRSNNVSIQDVPSISFLKMDEPSQPLMMSVLEKSGLTKIVKTTQILLEQQGKLSW